MENGGLHHRWLRQDGYSVGPAEWRSSDIVERFDLLEMPGVESKQFKRNRTDDELVRGLGDLEDTTSDPLALSVRGAFVAILKSLELVTPAIEAILRNSKTRDPDAELAKHVDDLIARAIRVSAPGELLATLQTLRADVGKFYWDTSFDCALASARERVHRLESV